MVHCLTRKINSPNYDGSIGMHTNRQISCQELDKKLARMARLSTGSQRISPVFMRRRERPAFPLRGDGSRRGKGKELPRRRKRVTREKEKVGDNKLLARLANQF